MGFLAYALTAVGLPWYASFLVGLLCAIAVPFLLRRFWRETSVFTRGDWLGQGAMVLFVFLAVWLLIVDLTSH